MNVNKLEWFLDMDPIDPGTDIRIKWGWNGKERIPNQLVAQLCGDRTGDRDAMGQFIVQACNSHAELLYACKYALELIRIARSHFPKSIRNRDRFTLENTCATLGKAIHKAEGAS